MLDILKEARISYQKSAKKLLSEFLNLAQPFIIVFKINKNDWPFIIAEKNHFCDETNNEILINFIIENDDLGKVSINNDILLIEDYLGTNFAIPIIDIQTIFIGTHYDSLYLGSPTKTESVEYIFR